MERKWPGHPTEWMIIPPVCLYCMCCLSEHTVAGLLTLLADGAVSAGLRDLHIGPWCFALQRVAVDRVAMRVELVKMFSTREELDGERVPLPEPARGDRRRAVLDSFKQLQIDFQAKRICIRKTVLRAI